MTEKFIVPQENREIGDRTYTIKMLPSKKAGEWREMAKPLLLPLVKVIEKLPQTNINKPRDLLPILMSITEPLYDSITDVILLVRSWSPDIEADWKDYLADNAYDPQWMSAFILMLKYAFPFDQMKDMVTSRGPSDTITSLSLPEVNGGSTIPIQRGKPKPKRS